jgi:hypothetical protein
MRKFFITLTVLAIAVISANAEEKTKTYDFGDITGINAGYNYQIHITEGRSGKVKVVYDENMEKYLDVEYSVASKRLNLFMSDDIQRLFRNRSYDPIHVYVEMDDISIINLSGAVKADFKGTFKTESLDMELSGASSASGLEISGHTLEVECSGASNLDMTGRFSNEIEIDLSGASNIDYNGGAEKLNADISGASNMNCFGDFRTLKISCSGASNADIEGIGLKADYDCSGASNIEAKKFVVRTAEVELTGASKAKVHATSELRHNVSRASKMTYYGNAKLVNLSNDSNIINGN